jgi:hypothetical protein
MFEGCFLLSDGKYCTFINNIIYKEITCQDDCKKLQSDLDAAARWEADWLMAFHPDKCTVLTITQKKTPFKHDYICCLG